MACTNELLDFHQKCSDNPPCYTNELTEMGFTFEFRKGPMLEDRFLFQVKNKHERWVNSPNFRETRLVEKVCFEIKGISDIAACIAKAVEIIKVQEIKPIIFLPEEIQKPYYRGCGG